MNRILSTLFCLIFSIGLYAQSVTDTVSIGAAYSNQTWYSFENGSVASAPKNNWHLAFEISGFTSSIRINGAIGLELYLDPEGSTDNWANLDTADLAVWEALYDSETSWAAGAFNQPADIENEFDLGWGTYSFITHQVIGDRLFVLKISEDKYYKIWIEKLAGGTYTFKTARLDGSEEATHTLAKADFAGKNFAYFNVETGESIDREPVSSGWDLVFTQYVSYIPDPYVVTGVLTNSGVQSARIYPVDIFEEIDPSSVPLDSAANIIGYDWKVFDLATFSWKLQDSLVFVVKDKEATIWKTVFTGFGGQGTGNFIFEKEILSQPNATTEAALNILQLLTFPNPAKDQLNLVFDLPVASQTADIRIFNIQGKLISQQKLSNLSSGLNTHNLSLHDLHPGMYIIQTQAGNYSGHSKISVY
jgi:hypothetical protein